MPSQNLSEIGDLRKSYMESPMIKGVLQLINYLFNCLLNNLNIRISITFRNSLSEASL